MKQILKLIIGPVLCYLGYYFEGNTAVSISFLAISAILIGKSIAEIILKISNHEKPKSI